MLSRLMENKTLLRCKLSLTNNKVPTSKSNLGRETLRIIFEMTFVLENRVWAADPGVVGLVLPTSKVIRQGFENLLKKELKNIFNFFDVSHKNLTYEKYYTEIEHLKVD